MKVQALTYFGHLWVSQDPNAQPLAISHDLEIADNNRA